MLSYLPTARTVPLGATVVNTLVPMTTRGERLSAYLQAVTGGRHGWQAKIVRDSGVKRQTITKWTRPGFDGYPDPEALAAVAKAAGVRPWQIVAAIDGDEDVVSLRDPGTKATMRALLEELLAERDARRPPRTPRAEGGAA
jgi:hypothetical protein